MRLTNRSLLLVAIFSTACWAQTSSGAQNINCTFSPAVTCPQLTVAGDPYSTVGGFAGYADPSIRQDPDNPGTIWMAYSWPTITSGNTKPIEIHLAYNSGSGWTNSGLSNYVLYPSTTVNNQVTGATDDQTANEVISLAMQSVNGATYVYQVHLNYQVANGQVGPLGQPYTARLMISGCAFTSSSQGPDCLLSAKAQYLGGSIINSTYWPISQNLSTLSGSSCTKFGEPTIIVSGNTLLLNTVCLDNYSYYYQFAASNPQGDLGNWTWSYVGTFGSTTDANLICSYFDACNESLFFNACELAPSPFSGHLVVCNVDYNAGPEANNVVGSIAIAMASLNPPAFAYTSSGMPEVVAYMSCSQCTAHGPGAPAYDPAYGGGIVNALVLTDCTGGSAGCDSRSGFQGEFTQLGITALPATKPAINAGGVINAASYAPGVALAPGSIASAFGTFLLTSPTIDTILPVPDNLSGLSIQFNGQYAAPLYFVSSLQVNLQVPWELAGQSKASITASLDSQTSAAETVPLADFGPGIFTTNSEGTGQGAVLDTSYKLVNSSNPTTAGSTIFIYCTGLGAVTNQPATGSPAPASPLARTVTTPTVTIGGATADVQFSGLAPDYVGLYQVNAVVPSGSTTGSAVPITISMGSVTSNTVTIAVQ